MLITSSFQSNTSAQLVMIAPSTRGVIEFRSIRRWLYPNSQHLHCPGEEGWGTNNVRDDGIPPRSKSINLEDSWGDVTREREQFQKRWWCDDDAVQRMKDKRGEELKEPSGSYVLSGITRIDYATVVAILQKKGRWRGERGVWRRANPFPFKSSGLSRWQRRGWPCGSARRRERGSRTNIYACPSSGEGCKRDRHIGIRILWVRLSFGTHGIDSF